MTVPVDQAARDRIRTDTASTLFVNAGAGSGKTTALISRILTLVLDDGVPLASIAAVTFTEKAGAELRDRLRAQLEAERRTSEGERRVCASQALDDLDGAAIGTLHAFAQRILAQHAIAAGLPPVLEVLDEVGSSVAFAERWAVLQTALLDDDDMEEPLLLGLAIGLKLEHVRSLAKALGANWDLIASRVLVGDPGPIRLPDLTAFLRQARDVVASAATCTNADDLLLPKILAVSEPLTALEAAIDDGARMSAIRAISALKFSHGRAGSWADIDAIRTAAKDLAADATELVAGLLDACLRRVTRWTAERVLDTAAARRRDGRLEFHDLLVLARELLARDAAARADLHDTYQRLLLDEFQDTDPIQIEIAVRIAGGADADQAQWTDVVVPSGRLFVVGDAKQSIYKFRRASIATYLDAQEHVGEPVSLTTNFRTVAPVLDWVNTAFSQLITATPQAQPAYEPLDQFRDELGRGSAVVLLGADAHTDLPRAAAAILREREATDVAGIVRHAIDDHWQVYEESAHAWRAAELSDVAILVPARTSLPFLEDAFEAAGVPYRAESSSLVYEAAEVRDLLACARAIADPTDELSLVTALRSPLFGCGDDDLWRWKRDGGRFVLWSRKDEDATGPVADALLALRRLSAAARWSSPSELLGAIIDDRRMLEVAATGPRARDGWRRLRFVVDQARAWSEVSHGGLRAYLAWAAFQGQEATRVAESVLPETDVNAVRVMTIHAAKGLEFPIVIMSGMTAQPNRPRGVQLLWPPAGGYAVKLGAGVQTGDFDDVAPVDEQMDAMERVRLLYVAATRARDHLVVSLHRAAGSTAGTSAAILAGAAGATDGLSFVAPTLQTPHRQVPQATVVSVPPYDEWQRGIVAARASAAKDASIVASGLEGTEPEVVLTDVIDPGLAKGPRDLELPPWSKGRYGSAIGRAVHAVLQTADLATGDGLPSAAAAQAVAEGVTAQVQLVEDLARSAIVSDLVRRAATRENWRETYVGTLQDDGTILEGYVDLIFRDDDGTLVVVDYKTDAIPAGAVESRVVYYRPQLEAYARCVRDATGAPVRAVLLFLHPEGSVEREVGLDPSFAGDR
ncbi:UvrD-helicase domain-containing protein [Cellulomonas humilata]|uniref:DNA 3'-5' helicase n=1 Tax=Cellulomonas humilata TaxID=144055 RepID=A0A7Y6DYB1_9CELL|nr:UvrD-helicase domain-containing protein [Cellulomonas humilata]NUU18473.1 UvrD-helicase domain-containing protein [Cellulomonas humilata]